MQAELQEYFNASLLYQRLHKRISSQLKPYKLTPQQAIVLAVIQDQPMSCSEVGEVMNVSLPMVTTLTKQLQRSGHITREPYKGNKKFKVLAITDIGRSVFAESV